ncbi:MAG: MarR family transcriptional regulator [Devosia sp.]|nr:MarR family transcriptional regulator [Devosia sp.]
MDELCYCIAVRKAARRITGRYDEALAPLGINLAQFSLLRSIERRGKISLTELARGLELDRSTVGRNVKVLQRARLVTAETGTDQREATVGLTGHGREIFERALPIWQATQTMVDTALGPQKHELLDALAIL